MKAEVVVHQPVLLPPSVFPGIPGHADFDPGIASLEIEQPGQDLYFLDLNSSIQFEFVGSDAGMQIVTDHPLTSGETLLIASPPFDFHLVFNIPAGQIGSVYTLQIRFHDLSGIHTSSEVVTITFSPAVTTCTCRGDLEADAMLDGGDVQGFLNCFVSTPAAALPEEACFCADMNGDGLLDPEDVEHFVAHLLDGEACG